MSNRYKDPTKPDPIAKTPATPQPSQEEEETETSGRRSGTRGGYKRKSNEPSAWGMSSEELARRQERAEDPDAEPEQPDIPR